MKASGNAILITGGGSGMGLALAEAFLRAGNEVVLCGGTQTPLDAALARLPALRTFTCDIAREQDRQILFDRVREYFPRLNVLINNASVAKTTDLTHAGAAERVATELAVDLRAPILLTMQFLPHLLQQPEAAVVNVTTALAYVPAARYPVYCAAQAGLHSFSQSLRHQLQGTSVSVFEVLPPAVDTRLDPETVPKLSPREVAEQVLRGMHRSVSEIRIGQTRMLYAIARLLPSVAFSLLNR